MSDSDIRRLGPDDLDLLIAQQRNAYPGFFARDTRPPEQIRAYFERSMESDSVRWFGLFDGDDLIGSMRVHDFVVNVRGVPVPSGGVGAVAVSLYRKKQRVAKRLMDFYLEHFLQKGVSFCLLWPFRPDFYRKMGFGYGGPVYRYQVPAESFPDSQLRKAVREGTADDLEQIGECYHRYASRINGMVLEEGKTPKHLTDALEQKRLAVFAKDDRIEGFLVYQFGRPEPDHALQYDLKVTRLIYDAPDALGALCGFIRSQQDQVRTVLLDLPDDSLHFLLEDPRDARRELYQPIYHRSGGVGIGIMYRVIDTPGLVGQLQQATFGSDAVTLGVTLTDTFLPSNNGQYTIRFENGKASLAEAAGPELSISLDVAEFSSLLMGAVTLEKLYLYGRATISDKDQVERITKLFATDHKPNCLHPF